mmetsp:Transcript_43419/g.52531  ORF Transcript_43419/g.52531 Transcript_43419/m.52531 type:complete len:284 (-) Transcript_43419:526-1377(-)|eukprot:CAMPEP_0197852524 /NCGR_PEP_ID=MMETSP1438-20131217/20805_1 /TAXON_ID=1461541 /ORGANISM="Pterosperma sp., Strain CCMP1384" /LENGTH=283 /DNA_ID=CAMNT_0043466611 /DNA_START=143 /DNA_END=994 /DNA_ORIENTATION=+
MQPAPLKHSAYLGPGVVPPQCQPIQQSTPGNAPTNGILYPSASGQPFAVAPGSTGGPHQRTQYPYVTGTSVLALKYKDGVMMACDTLGAYGSTKRFKSVERMKMVGDNTVIGASGEYSDFHHILKMLDELTTEDYCEDDGQKRTPKEIFSYLTRVLYNRRNKFDPLWNSLVVAGHFKGESYLGTVGMIGVAYEDSHVATGFGAHLARPLFRERQYDDMPEAEAKELLEDALRVCYYRDKNSINKFQLSKITADGCTISEPYALPTDWHYKAFVNPQQAAIGTW